MKRPQVPAAIRAALNAGVVIPAHPLALDAARRLDERHQRALTRYYLAAGAGGVAVGVHTTQFEIRRPEIGLLRPVLELAQTEIDAFTKRTGKNIVKIAGIVGLTPQAVSEAQQARDLDYHAGLLSLAALTDADNKKLMAHCKTVAEIIPLVGFYLQTAVGGRKLDLNFWREFVRIENVVAIKIAPFNRYQTLDVVRAVAESGREKEVALYTGNDDAIVSDLLTEYAIPVEKRMVSVRIVGGLLGHWAVWTQKAVALLQKIKNALEMELFDPLDLLTLGTQITACNAAFFDAANDFKGSIVGIHEVLRRQGLLAGNWTLNPADVLSPQQAAEIDRVYAAHPELNDDAFVAENLDRWLA